MTLSPRRSGRAWVQLLLVVAILVASVAAAKVMIGMREEPEAKPRPVVAPLVELIDVILGPVELEVATLGELRPRREGALTPEIGGRVKRLAPTFVQGGFVSEGDALVELDAEPLRVGVLAAEAQVAQAEARASRLEAEAERSVAEWRRAGRTGDPPPLVAKTPDLAEARALVASAEASLQEAQLDLDRATVRAPFTGRVRSVRVTEGAYVQRGQELGELYQTEPMELRMNLTERELGQLDAEQVFGPSKTGPRVDLTIRMAGRSEVRTARVVRVGGEVDPVSRMVELVAELDAAGEGSAGLPLLAGDFARARVQGRRVERAARLPRIALYEPGLCLVVGKEGTLERRRVNVALQTKTEVIVDEGLAEGDRVVVSPLDVAVDGMLVRVVVAEAAEADEAGPAPEGGGNLEAVDASAAEATR